MVDTWGTFVDWLRVVGVVELANVAGLFAALGAIWFTFLQLLMLRRQLKLDAIIRIMDSNRSVVALGFDHPVVWAAMEDSPSTGLADEALAHRRYRQLWMNHMQVMWSAWRLGLVSGFEWEAFRQDMTEFMRSASLRQHWAGVSQFYPKDFRRLIQEIAKPGAEMKKGGPEEGVSVEKPLDEDCLRAQSTKP